MYKCKHCDQDFSTKGNLKKHENKKNKCYDDFAEKYKELAKELTQQISQQISQQFTDEIQDLKNMMKCVLKKNEDDSNDNKKSANSGNNISNSGINVNSTVNSNNNNSNNVMFNFQQIEKNFNTAHNLEDVMKVENITDDMYKECNNKYINDGATHIFRKLCVDNVELNKRAIHCLDPARRNYAIRTQNIWRRDHGGSVTKSICEPVVKTVYEKVTKKLLKDKKLSEQKLMNLMLDQSSYGKKDEFNKTLDETASDLRPCYLENNLDKKIKCEEDDLYVKFMETKTRKSKTHLHTKVLYDHFCEWYSETISKDNIPSNIVFFKNIRKNFLIHNSVKVDGKVSMGMKNLELC